LQFKYEILKAHIQSFIQPNPHTQHHKLRFETDHRPQSDREWQSPILWQGAVSWLALEILKLY